MLGDDAKAPTNDRAPAPELSSRVNEFFNKVSRLQGDGVEQFLRGRNEKPSRPEARVALGFTNSQASAWARGHEDGGLTFATHLCDALKGDFYFASNRTLAERIWKIFQQDSDNVGYAVRLRLQLETHRMRLAGIADGKDDHAVVVADRPNVGPSQRPPGERWSAPWTAVKVVRSTQRLVRGTDRILYFYGAVRSGKSALIAALVEQLRADPEEATLLHLNVRDLAVHFRQHGDVQALHVEILTKLLHQLEPDARAWRLSEDYRFDHEMVQILSRAPSGKIYLVLEAGDACLRLKDGGLDVEARDATAPLFDFLRPVTDGSAQPTLCRISAVIEGARPLADLATTYPASGLNKGRSEVLDRFGHADCAEIARLAGFERAEDTRRLLEQTGGHRSLIWAILSELEADDPLPDDLASLKRVSDVVRELMKELKAQPDLNDGLALVIAGRAVDFETRTRLEHTMYVSRGDPAICGCPILEAMVNREAPA